MDLDRGTRLLTLVAKLGVILGIVLLVLEMRQNSAIATAQIRLDYASGWRSVDESRQDESFSRVFAKSIQSPAELSLNELIQLDAYYSGVLDQLLSAYAARQAGLVDTPFHEVARTVSAIYFSNHFSQSWWKQVRADWATPSEGDFQEIMDEAILREDTGRLREKYEGLQRTLAERANSS